METIRNKTAELFQKIYNTFADFKITMILLVLWTVSLAVGVSLSDYEPVIEFLCRFLMLLFLSSLFAETCFKGKKKGMLVFYPLAGVLSGVLAYLITQEDIGYSLDERAQGIMAGYAIVMLVLTVYFSFRKSGLSFPEYSGRVLSDLLPVSLIYMILTFGLLFVVAAIGELLGGDYLVDIALILPFTLYFIPGCIYALNHVDKEINPSFGIIIKYIINIFSICIIFIGYVYILKIIVLREVPSNEIFSILTVLFVMSAPVWVMNEIYRDGTLRSKVVSVLPYVFAPLICMQIYSLAVRIWEYGFTCERYLGIMVIIFEISMIVIWRFDRSHCERLMLVLSVLICISVVIPGINMYSVSDRSQEYFLNKYMQKAEAGEELSELEYKRLEGAYQYQKERMDEAEFESAYGETENILEEEKDGFQKQWHYLHGCQLVGEIDTSNFSKMNMLNQSDTYVRSDSDEIIVDFSKFEFYKRETGEKIEIDLSDFYKKCMEYKAENPNSTKEEDSTYMKQFNIIPIDEDSTFYVNHFEVNYYTVKENGEKVSKIRTINISGMLLER
ncbi:MAG: hypothetical protein ACI4SD_00380 [Suilimivivens sp.]